MNKLIITTLACAGVFLSTSCLSNYEEYNTNPSEVTDDQMNADDKKAAAALTGMQGSIMATQVHLYQFIDVLCGDTYGGYFADAKPWSDSFALFNPSDDWKNKPMETIVNIYKNQKLLRNTTTDPVLLAINDVVRLAAMVRLADMYGPIPYSKIGDDGNTSTPYDSQKEIYTKMFTELNSALEQLTANRTGAFSPNADIIFGGKVEKWIKFANTLKLRMAMRISYADAALAEQMAVEAATHEVGTMTANDDNAFLKVTVNPLTTIISEWGNSRVSADVSSYMNGYADPRRGQYMAESTFSSSSITNGYHGYRVGYNGLDMEQAMQYSSVNITMLTKRGLPVMYAAEAAFLKAEGAIRGWNMGGGTARSYYEQGVQLSFEQWEAGSAAAYLANSQRMPESYKDPKGINNNDGTPSDITVAWDDAAPFEKMLERIITQKWIANYPLGHEAWAEHRRTGYPYLMKSVINKSGGVVNDLEGARRIPYPPKEYQQNGTNVSAAVQLLGGPDNMATHTWWDCKNKK